MLRQLFAPGFEARAHALVQPAFGAEYMVALEPAHVLVLRLEAPLGNAGFVPCPGKPQCQRWSDEAALRARARVDTLALDAFTHDVLWTLWYEVLARAPLHRRDNLIQSDGTTYSFRLGELTAEAWSPRGPSVASAMTRLVQTLRDAASAPHPGRARVQVRDTADSLLAVVLAHGGEEPLSSARDMPYPRALRRCGDAPPPVPYLYCWQADLDADPYPEWIVATREDTTYTYRLFDTINDPTARPYVRTLSGVVPRWAMEEGEAYRLLGPPMRPWEIVDLSRAMRPGQVNLFAGVRRVEGRTEVGIEVEGRQPRVAVWGQDPWAGLLAWRSLDALFEAAGVR